MGGIREGQQQGSPRGGAIPVSLGRPQFSRASIIGIRETGMVLNGDPVLDIDLLIGTDHEEPFRATAEGAVPLSALVDVVIGADVGVHYHRDEPSVVVIDWDGTATS
jgi:hypothetical protein